MVKLNVEMMTKKPSGRSRLKGNEDVSKYLARVTHLNLQDQEIDCIESELASCPNLTVLYLYDNLLTEIPNLALNKRLHSLYLQNNKISYIENLETAKSIKKLHLGHNNISMLEGLEGLGGLEELYVEHQSLPPGDSLIIDPLSIKAISTSLRIVDVRHNNLREIGAFRVCHVIEEFIASNNQLSSVEELVDVIKDNWTCVTKISFANNPVAKEHRYRDAVVHAAFGSLEILDEKEVTAVSKEFIRGFQEKIDFENALKRTRVQTIVKKKKKEDANGKGCLVGRARRLSAKKGAGDGARHRHEESFKYPLQAFNKQQATNTKFFSNPPPSEASIRHTHPTQLQRTTEQHLNINNNKNNNIKKNNAWKQQNVELNLHALRTPIHSKESHKSRTDKQTDKDTDKQTDKKTQTRRYNSPETLPLSSLGFYID